jgi:2-hydroxychromene-2-carboxylate isomerase
MAIGGVIAPHVMRLLTSPVLQSQQRARAERRRLRRKQPHLVTVYLRINDPYSYLLLQVLEQLASRYPLTYDFRTVLSLQQDMYPAPGLWEKNAFKDGVYLAGLYDLRFPGQRPQSSPQRDARLTAQLLHWELQPGYLDNALRLFQAYWEADGPAADALVDPRVAGHVECYRHHLQANENLLEANGHYLSAMLHYGGEWYWGLDRLEHLERRFNAMGVGDGQVLFDRGYRNFCRQLSADRIPAAGGNKAIEIFWSLRSPYSYLGLLRARQLAGHYHVPLVVKPVLPMVMRRMQVPKAKSFYITLDAKREALKYGIDFGFIADPLGKGVERCYALYAFAEAAGKGIGFLESCARGVWAEGIRSDTDAGLKVLVERAGLAWGQARGLLQDDSWRFWAQENLAEMYGHDLWGVPSFTYGEVKVFGQDRLDCIERAIVGDLVAAGN